MSTAFASYFLIKICILIISIWFAPKIDAADLLWMTTCSGSCTNTINVCNELPYFCISPSICERCIKNQAGGCYACSLALSNLAQSYVEQGPQVFKVAEMAGSCTSVNRPLCRYACRYRSWNEGECDANKDCICRISTNPITDVY